MLLMIDKVARVHNIDFIDEESNLSTSGGEKNLYA